MTRCLIDANVAIDLIRHPDVAWPRFAQSTLMYVPVIVVGELLFGAGRSRHAARNIALVDRLAAGLHVIPADMTVARCYGQVRGTLEDRGRRIPENDMWIAATAMATSLPLVTADAHSTDVDGLTIVTW